MLLNKWPDGMETAHLLARNSKINARFQFGLEDFLTFVLNNTF